MRQPPQRKIPAVIATQHPDNASAPYWRDSASAYISTADEVDECYFTFADLNCGEYMWDWEGKFVDEAVVDRLFFKFGDYFKTHQLGREKFLTFRVPNIWRESGARLPRALMGILTAAQAARDFGVHAPPLFEVILPMTTTAAQLTSILRKFRRLLQYERKIFDSESFGNARLEMIPLIEGSISLLDSRSVLLDYIREHEHLFGSRPSYIRPFIARSDPALDAGFVPATLAARGAISEYYRFQRETGVPVYPILGGGSLPFRGGVAPDKLDRFFSLYSGVRTVTVQSAFRYDFPKEAVTAAIFELEKRLPESEPVLFGESELAEIEDLAKRFAEPYRRTIQGLADAINTFAPFIPRHRERIPHTGHFGYSRRVGTSSVALPRAIAFTAILYSLGIPPTFIGTGRGMRELKKKGLETRLDRYFPGLLADLVEEGAYYNAENLALLAAQNPAWRPILKDVAAIEAIAGEKLGPKRPRDLIYRNLTSTILQLFLCGETEALPAYILEAGRARRSLG